MLSRMTHRAVNRIKKSWLNGKFLVKKIVSIEKLNKRKEKVFKRVVRRIVVLHHLLLPLHPPDGRDVGMSNKNHQRPPRNHPKTRSLQRSDLDGIKLLL